ncbi:MAG: fasciclin domain-containing protein [Fuerstiella sp.]
MPRLLSQFTCLFVGFALSVGCGEGTETADTTAPETTGVQPPVADEPTDNATEMSDIVDTAVATEGFATLVAAVKAAGLVDTLKGEGPFTVFAPTDAAFAALPEGTLDDLLKPENKDKLTSILTYHVVSGKVMAADVVKVTSAKTVQGGEVAVAVDGGTVTVDGATVTATDIECSNGVIHVIDAVILPKE